MSLDTPDVHGHSRVEEVPAHLGELAKKLAWFVMGHMSLDIPFCDAVALNFSDEDLGRFDELTDFWFSSDKEKQEAPA